MEAVTSKELLRIAEACIVPGSTILSDGLVRLQKTERKLQPYRKRKKALPAKSF